MASQLPNGSTTAVAVVGSVVVGVGLGWAAYVATPSDASTPVSSAQSEASASATSSSKAPDFADPDEEAPTKKAVACTSEEVKACLIATLPAKTFLVDKSPDLSFICTENNPVKGSGAIRSAVVRGAGSEVTDTMKQWAVLGWYELAAFAAIRGRCCGKDEALKMPPHPEACSEIVPTLEAFGRDAADPATTPKDRRELTDAYTEAVLCLARARATKVFGQPGAPGGGASTKFEEAFETISNAPICSAPAP